MRTKAGTKWMWEEERSAAESEPVRLERGRRRLAAWEGWRRRKGVKRWMCEAGLACPCWA